ncbi:ras and ef-hand domain-containing protein [Anaeramoeba ignava]|uniref:Ras and ef-hand domain-containing protein n=1 Tax=Anaeramoeba ignava TaxID=1746090 RepID=A0A9Q0R5L5_ANAIG|nr:ras and ef-hand domain-containing protein [Anaeramoeba ignava]
MMEELPLECLYKVVVVGAPRVGKTSYIKRLTSKEFNGNESTTIGVDYYIKTLEINKKQINIQIWENKIIIIKFNNNNNIFLIIINNYSILIGNKCDKQSQITVDLKEYSAKNGYSQISFVSAKNQTNIETSFLEIVKKILQNSQHHQIHQFSKKDFDGIIVNNNEKKKQNGCC